MEKGRKGIPNQVSLYLKQQFDQLLKQEQYDAVIISYAYWAFLLEGATEKYTCPFLIDTHDFLTAQHRFDHGYDAGLAFADEISRLSRFNRIWAISPEEHYLFTQMLGPRVDYVPAWVTQPETTNTAKETDLIYVATDNPHNKRSFQWFAEEVWPLLSPYFSLTIIGSIVPHTGQLEGRVQKISYVEQLDSYYAKSRLAICPMLTGTGVKLKVIEALAHGLPVVCNTRGLDGLPQKLNNGCLSTDDPTKFAGFIENLLTNPVFYERTASLARETYRLYFSEEKGFEQLDQAFTMAGLT